MYGAGQMGHGGSRFLPVAAQRGLSGRGKSFPIMLIYANLRHSRQRPPRHADVARRRGRRVHKYSVRTAVIDAAATTSSGQQPRPEAAYCTVYTVARLAGASGWAGRSQKRGDIHRLDGTSAIGSDGTAQRYSLARPFSGQETCRSLGLPLLGIAAPWDRKWMRGSEDGGRDGCATAAQRPNRLGREGCLLAPPSAPVLVSSSSLGIMTAR